MMRFVDWLWYSDEGLTLTKWGKEGETYTVTEDTSWSWRYKDVEAQEITLKPSNNEVTVVNTLNNNNWLGASSYAINRCVKNIATDVLEIVKNIFGN